MKVGGGLLSRHRVGKKGRGKGSSEYRGRVRGQGGSSLRRRRVAYAPPGGHRTRWARKARMKNEKRVEWDSSFIHTDCHKPKHLIWKVLHWSFVSCCKRMRSRRHLVDGGAPAASVGWPLAWSLTPARVWACQSVKAQIPAAGPSQLPPSHPPSCRGPCRQLGAAAAAPQWLAPHSPLDSRW